MSIYSELFKMADKFCKDCNCSHSRGRAIFSELIKKFENEIIKDGYKEKQAIIKKK